MHQHLQNEPLQRNKGLSMREWLAATVSGSKGRRGIAVTPRTVLLKGVPLRGQTNDSTMSKPKGKQEETPIRDPLLSVSKRFYRKCKNNEQNCGRGLENL